MTIMKLEAKQRLQSSKHGGNTALFLSQLSQAAEDEILNSIAKHYQISKQEAREEITSPEAEHLLDYLVGPARLATSVLLQRHHFPTK